MKKQEVIPLAGLPPVCLGFGDMVLLPRVCVSLWSMRSFSSWRKMFSSLSDIRLVSDNPNAYALLVVRYPHSIGQPVILMS